MPVVTFNVPATLVSEDKGRQLTRGACEVFAQVLEAPVERIRAFINVYPEWTASAGFEAGGAPFYQFYVLADRTPQQVAALHQSFTQLLVDVLACERSVIRGTCLRIDPSDWGIAGKPASEIRKAELDARR
ncbi:hypothetical protein [Oceanobacter mangrovi]|uniref:hypothetical protein n=1 Tax=Oceanobacter mangrovi TaxID=2862510 RepID=UPI001C8EFD42|nr:hypothetical protein [Oceanobacter mangrovi]